MAEHSQIPAAIAKAIREIREREGLTQEQLAVKAGVHLTWITRAESGRRDMRVSSLGRLADALGVGLVEIAALAERNET